ncbi:MAG: SPOR domain-containing protein [Flavobacteriales bacterium]|nr:SPOR domain-containing protein [Flavobacteriales bacterium]
MALDRYIHDLLFEHDCVIVPGFGGFLTHYRPARLDVQRRLIHPPSKDLSFNRKLVRQDGLLVDRVVRCEGLEFHAAKQRVDAELERWQQELRNNDRLELARVGTLFHDAEHNLQFEPDRRVNFLKDAYGLKPVEAVAVQGVAVPPLVQRPVVEAYMAGHERKGTMGYLLAAAVAAIAFTAATWYVVAPSGTIGLAFTGPEAWWRMDQPHYRLPGAPELALGPVEASIWTVPSDSYGIQALPIAGPNEPLVAVNLGQSPPRAVPESTAVATPAVGLRFHIIGGCFLEKENADRFVSELQAKGFAASVIDRKGGLFRVAYGSYPQRQIALEALNAVRKEEAPQAWLLVK